MSSLADDWALQLSWRWLKTWLLIAGVVFAILTLLHVYLGLPNDGCALRALGLAAGDCSATSSAMARAASCPVRLYLWLDFVFIAGYVGTLYMLVRWAQVDISTRRPGSGLLRLVFRTMRWSSVIVLGACAAVDVAENLLTLAVIERGASGTFIPPLAEWKFRLFFVAAGLALVAVALRRAAPSARPVPLLSSASAEPQK